MSKVEILESQVRDLSGDELRIFREWFARFDDEVWDAKIETDASNGKLDALAKLGLDSHRAGLSKPL